MNLIPRNRLKLFIAELIKEDKEVQELLAERGLKEVRITQKFKLELDAMLKEKIERAIEDMKGKKWVTLYATAQNSTKGEAVKLEY